MLADFFIPVLLVGALGVLAVSFLVLFSIISDCFNRTTQQCFFARCALLVG
jgi:hypothetical protein